MVTVLNAEFYDRRVLDLGVLALHGFPHNVERRTDGIPLQ
jgi:hypothetical protein